MRVVSITCNKTSNQFIDSIQKYCMMLMSQPELHGVYSLKDLENKTLDFVNCITPGYKRCRVDNLEVYYDSTVVSEWYNLLYGERSMMTVFARPDEFEKCFRDYDDLRYKQCSV